MKLHGGRHLCLACLIVLAAAPSAFAQTPPRPAVDVRQLPAMWNTVWPADFNRDGRTDLVAGERGSFTSQFGRVVVRLGNGNGTFGSAVASGVNGAPAATGDFNRDGRQDVVVIGANGAMSILPGRGDGRFNSPRTLDSVEDFKFALSGDFNADGLRDLVIGYGTTVEMNPGLGDFTFGPQMVLPPGNEFGVNAAIAGDFNGDSRLDLAVAQLFGSVFIYLNRGGMLFDASEIVIANEEMYGITTGDLDRDGDLDLIVPHTMQFIDWSEGGVEVLKGNGNGTFAAPVTYHTGVEGPFTVVVGQFNGDGLLDVAVGSRSWTYIDQNGPTFHYWDSVSIFPGRGDATLAAAAVFRLDTIPASPVGSVYVDTHHALKTSDVNGDGRTDLITSPGAIVLTRAAAANRNPMVNAGPDRSVDPDHMALMSPTIAEPDWDWLGVEWRDQSGRLVSRSPSFWFNTFETQTVTVTVRDVRGGTGTDSVVVYVPPGEYFFFGIDEPDSGETVSTMNPFTIEWANWDDPRIARFDLWSSINDGQTWTRITECANVAATADRCQWNVPGPVSDTARVQVRAYDASGALLSVAASERFRIVPGPRTSLPDRWLHGDVGAVGAAGDATFDGSTFTVRGSGADIWGTSDEFHWVFTGVSGDFDFVARVTSVQNVNQWTKAGIMVRNFGGAGAAHASLFATPSTVKGLSLQTRASDGGVSTEVARRALAPPVWLKAMRRGDAVYFAYRKAATDRWTLLPVVRPAPTNNVAIGLAVSSHVDGIVASATFDNVAIGEPVEPPTWQNRDIGSVGATGRRIPSTDPSSISLEGSGADIWGTADAFHYEYRQWFGDGVITARVVGVENTHAWAKAGVMFRESLTAGSRHVFALVSAGKGMAVQSRSTAGGTSASTTPRAGTPPKWIRLERVGNTFTAHTSSDGNTWTLLGTVTMAMSQDIFVGVAVTSHASGTLATAVFDDIFVEF